LDARRPPRNQTFDFLVSAHTVNPRTITADETAAYPKTTAEMKKDGELWRRSLLRQVKYPNETV
jgi:IS6 family transposase